MTGEGPGPVVGRFGDGGVARPGPRGAEAVPVEVWDGEVLDGELVEAGGGPTVALSVEAADLLARAPAANTVRTYVGHWRRFTAWCAGQGVSALPCETNTVVNYAAYLATRGRAAATIEGVAAAVRWHHVRAGVAPPDTERVWTLLRAHRRDQAEAGRRTRKARVLSPAEQRAVLRACDRSTVAGRRDAALLLLGFRTGRRFAELARLGIGDVVVDRDGLLYYIRRSKTDQTGQGATWQRLVPHHDPGLCVVAAVTAWRAVLAERGIVAGPLLRRVDRYGRVGGQSGMTGVGSATGALSNEAANRIWRAALRRAEIDPAGVSTHTARRSAMTNGHRAGVALTDLTDRLGYVRGSRVALGYIDAVEAAGSDPLAGLL